MRKSTRSIAFTTALVLLTAAPLLASGDSAAKPGEPSHLCADPPCYVPCPDRVDLLPYFIPNYSGWEYAKRIWTYKGGNQDCFRMFRYGPGKYELIKNCVGTATETFQVSSLGVYVTSEMGTPLQSEARLFNGSGLYFLPAAICRNRPTFQVCHEGQTFIDSSTCQTTGSTGPHCGPYPSRIEFAPTWNYGGSLGVIDSIIKIDTLDNGEVEKYWYGRNRGILRWEHWSASGVLLNWGQQTSEFPNSPTPHNSCYQP